MVPNPPPPTYHTKSIITDTQLQRFSIPSSPLSKHIPPPAESDSELSQPEDTDRVFTRREPKRKPPANRTTVNKPMSTAAPNRVPAAPLTDGFLFEDRLPDLNLHDLLAYEVAPRPARAPSRGRPSRTPAQRPDPFQFDISNLEDEFALDGLPTQPLLPTQPATNTNTADTRGRRQREDPPIPAPQATTRAAPVLQSSRPRERLEQLYAELQRELGHTAVADVAPRPTQPPAHRERPRQRSPAPRAQDEYDSEGRSRSPPRARTPPGLLSLHDATIPLKTIKNAASYATQHPRCPLPPFEDMVGGRVLSAAIQTFIKQVTLLGDEIFADRQLLDRSILPAGSTLVFDLLDPVRNSLSDRARARKAQQLDDLFVYFSVLVHLSLLQNGRRLSLLTQTRYEILDAAQLEYDKYLLVNNRAGYLVRPVPLMTPNFGVLDQQMMPVAPLGLAPPAPPMAPASYPRPPLYHYTAPPLQPSTYSGQRKPKNQALPSSDAPCSTCGRCLQHQRPCEPNKGSDPYGFSLTGFNVPHPYDSANTAPIPLRPNASSSLRTASVVTNPAIFKTPELAAIYRTKLLTGKFAVNNADLAQLQRLLAALPSGN